MLCDKVPRARVQRACEERAEDEVPQRVATKGLDEEVIERDLSEDVEEVQAGEGEGVDHHGAEGVEQDLEGAEEGFTKEGVEEEGLEGGGEVSVKTVDAERFVVR